VAFARYRWAFSFVLRLILSNFKNISRFVLHPGKGLIPVVTERGNKKLFGIKFRVDLDGSFEICDGLIVPVGDLV